jgi:hypothetical protein
VIQIVEGRRIKEKGMGMVKVIRAVVYGRDTSTGFLLAVAYQLS